MALFGSKWSALRTEGGSRSEVIDRLEAYLKTNGLKTKITNEGTSLKRIHVKKNDFERAQELLKAFDKDN